MAIYRVTVGDKEYQVEIEDVNAQPVRAVVNGRVIQVWIPPQTGATAPAATPPVSPQVASPPPTSAGVAPMAAAQPGPVSDQEVRAPMPGTIVNVAVQPGDTVEVGQDLCILDAMKMNNRIRASRAGTVNAVHVQPGQQVQYGDLLVTLA